MIEILLNHLAANNWNPQSIDQVKQELEDFRGIVAVTKNDVFYSYSKMWRINQDEALKILQKHKPRAIFFKIGI